LAAKGEKILSGDFGDVKKYFKSLLPGEYTLVATPDGQVFRIAKGELGETSLELAARNGDGVARTRSNGAGGATPKTKAEILAENKANGRAFEVEKVSELNKVANNVEEQITIVTKDGTKIRVDAMGYDKSTEKLVIQEYKSSATAPLTKNQDLGFPQITESGGLVVGKGKGVFKGGFEIPTGTEIKVIRPK